MPAIVGCAIVFVPPCTTFWVLFPKDFRFVVHALLCIAIRLMFLAVADLLGHVPHFSAWQPGDERTQLPFWAHMADILQVVAIHLGIC